MPLARGRPTEAREEAEPGTVMAHEWVLQAVRRLQQRLATSTHPKKLRKYLKKLSALPVTQHVLLETGVRKTVKSLRKHELVGGLARDLAARWKSSAPLEGKPRPGPQDSEDGRSPKRPEDALPKEHMDTAPQENWREPGSPSHSPGRGRRVHRGLWQSQTRHQRSPGREWRDQSKKRPRTTTPPPDWGSRDRGHVQASRWSTSPHPPVLVRHSGERSGFPGDTEPTAPGHVPAKDLLHASRGRTGLPPAGTPRGPQEKETDGNPDNQKGRESDEEEFEEPAMSFEAYLTYDQPPKKKKKGKTSAAARKEKERRGEDAEGSKKLLDWVQNLALGRANQSQERRPGQGDWAETGGVCTQAPRVLPHPPFPSRHDGHSPPPAYQRMSCFQPNGTALSSPHQEEGAGFTGHRTNSKMPVYSGCRRGHLAPVTSHPQGGRLFPSPASLGQDRALPPPPSRSALHTWTPDQLYHREKRHQVTAEEADPLWRLHCHTEFKDESPQESESWREMYLRLRDAREQRLRALTRRIRAAHPEGPPGRKTKMIFFQWPGDVPRSQQDSGTVAEAASGKPKFQPAQYPPGSRDTPSSTTTTSSGFHPRAQRPADASSNHARDHPAPGANTGKPTGKKTPPLLAKTIKDYKRHISRR